VRVLQALDASGNPIFTMMNLADHNQDIGQSDTYEVSHAFSGDWPGYFHRRLEQDVGGMAMFLAADIGSMEDLITVPRIPDPPCNSGANGCYAQVELTGNRIADHVAAALPDAQPVQLGAVDGRRTEFCAPIENNLFKAASQAGIFGERQSYTTLAGGCEPAGRTGDQVKTSVAVLDVGPDLQFIVNPGEAFPALMLGGPWGIEDASCPARANPPVPSWHARARYRFQVGLGDDLIGYEKPAWSFLYAEPTFTSPDCTTDPRHSHHGLEGEALGPTASNMLAQKLVDLLDQKPDPAAEIRLGRYVKADGSLTDAYTTTAYQGAPGHFPTDAVAIWLAAPGSTTLDAQPGQPDSGTIVALPNVGSFGGRRVDANGNFMDFDGADLSGGPDVTTRGMVVRAADGTVVKRYYVNVYPALSISGALGPATPAGYVRPKGATPVLVSLVPAFAPCASTNRAHAAPLAYGSCSPPAQASPSTTVGTGDSNGAPTNMAGSVRLDVCPIPGCAAPNVGLQVAASDVRCASGGPTWCAGTNAAAGPDYAGELRAVLPLRITDRYNGSSLTDPATVIDSSFQLTVPCAPTSGDATRGADCSVTTSANSVLPGSVVGGQRAIWELGQVEVRDGGSDGDADTTGDNRPFLRQGVFLP
jgi:hypothetical protein